MITYFMCKEFYKSGEFDETKNPYAGFDMFIRVPILIVLDIVLIAKVISFFL